MLDETAPLEHRDLCDTLADLHTHEVAPDRLAVALSAPALLHHLRSEFLGLPATAATTATTATGSLTGTLLAGGPVLIAVGLLLGRTGLLFLTTLARLAAAATATAAAVPLAGPRSGAVLLGALVGVPVGLRAAQRPNKLFDQVSRFVSLFGFSVPTY
ncbi:MAG: hypothetical protein ACPHGX_07940, partial [Ilumatobacteraceae bacterium]